MDPFGAKITFEHERITVEADELSQADLAEEATVNVSKRILIALENGPMFPSELQESLGVALKTVKNRLSDLKKSGRIKETGVTSGQAQQVALAGVPSVPIPIRDSTGDTSTETTTPTTEGPSPHALEDLEVEYRASWLRKFLDLDQQTREVGIPVLHRELVNQQLILPSADPEPTARAANILIREGSIKGRTGYIKGLIHEIRRDNKNNISEDPEMWAQILDEYDESVYPLTVELVLAAGA
jgi:DNA-binding Lrp family transcriptional regulator